MAAAQAPANAPAAAPAAVAAAPAPAAPASLAPVQDTSELGPYEDLKPEDEKPQSLISHLVSSLSNGQDLTRVLIPTFFLEPRSFLEKFTDLWTHPQYILNVASLDDPVQRMLSIVRWYVSGWHIRPKIGAHSICKKPYNPILGEEFFAYWDHGDSRTDFVAEQVSHHPPVSAIYIENRAKNLTINAHIYAKSKFLGNSAACENVGEAHLALCNRPGEEYVMTFPTYYACGLFIGKLRMEIGDKTKIVCKKTGLTAEFEFRTKPFVGGDYNRVRGLIRRDLPGGKHDKLYTFEGKWDGVIKTKNVATGKEEVLFDLANAPAVRKFVAPIAAQGPFESRRAWEDVSKALQKHDHNTATSAKTLLEDAQRKAAADRDAKKQKYDNKMFVKQANGMYLFNYTDLRPYDPKEGVKPLPTDFHKYKRDPALLPKAAPAAAAAAAAADNKKEAEAVDAKAAPAPAVAPAPAATAVPAQSMADFFGSTSASASPATAVPGAAATPVASAAPAAH